MGLHLLRGTRDTARTITLPSKALQRTLPNLAVHYVEAILKIKVDVTTPVTFVMEVARQQMAALNPKDELASLLDKSVPLAVKQQVTELFERSVKEQIDKITIYLTDTYKATGGAPNNSSSTSSMVITPVAKRKARGEGNTEEIKERDSLLAEPDVAVQVKHFVAIYNKHSDCPSALDEGSRQWYMRHVRKVGLCVTNCFAGNSDRFLHNARETQGDSLSKWYKYHCKQCSAKPKMGKRSKK
jgi:hypothetical protein